MFNKPISTKAAAFTESVIREMTRLALEHGAVNLSQGFPDFSAPAVLKQAASDAIFADVNQYAITWGSKKFRDAIAWKTKKFLGIDVDPEREITVSCGSTEGMLDALLAVINPGDEVIVFEPFYENYGPDAIISGAIPRYVQLRRPDWSFDPDELAAAFNNKTKAIIVNTPNNPTGKIFSPEELGAIARLCQKWDVLAITDEIYEHIIYDGARHTSMITLDGMRDRTIVVNGMSKTYSVTGWRVGYVLANPRLTAAIRKMHDFLTVGAPAPLQEAGASAMRLPDAYYQDLAEHYQSRRDRLLAMLRGAGFQAMTPRGAYYVMCDIASWGFPNDVEFARYLVREIGVAAVPGSSFFKDPAAGKDLIRFTFCKKPETFDAAEQRLGRLQNAAGRAQMDQNSLKA
ncbi:MAG TPA: aminotransferase class I/II-fold pyridoxal phosphate-dependent enzyme [Terriglobia bacterium]|nr:aminotransferase class I/II-fold pyridoxal phosphate-dependent enzyme [Terriglobia bacterium]